MLSAVRLLGSFTMESSLSLMPRTETTVEVEAGPAEDASAGLPFEAGGVPEPAQSVRPALRRRGIGSRALSHVLAFLAREGVRLVFLHVSGNNLPAVSLYKKAGFRIAETLSYYLY